MEEDFSMLHYPVLDSAELLGRDHELAVLRRLFVTERKRLVAIVGQPGTGKTSLVRVMMAREETHFLGGCAVAYDHPFGEREWLDAAAKLPSDKRSLLCIDEWGERRSAMPVLLELLERMPHLSVAVVSRFRVEVDGTPGIPHVVVGGLPEDAVRDLLVRYGLSGSEREIGQVLEMAQGNPAIFRALFQAVQGRGIAELADRLRPFLVTPPPPPPPLSVTHVSDQLLRELAETPELLHAVDPRKFEEIVAELLGRKGYEVRLTPPSKDGGRDILATLRTPLGRHLWLVECKRYAPDRPVQVHLVRQLAGVVHTEDATGGILVTTSRFTRGARRLVEEKMPHRLALRDYFDLQSWLSEVATRSGK